MFSDLFNYDNSVWRFIAKLWDVLILNLLWAVCCLPIVTIGASTTALHYVTLKMAEDLDSHHFKSFFKSFKINFRQSTVIWLIMLVVGGVIAFDIRFFYSSGILTGAVKNIIIYLFLVCAVVYASVLIYIFPLQCRFYNKIKTTFTNALLMSVRHFPRTVIMLAVDGGILFLMLTYLPWLVFWAGGLIAFINSYVLVKIFANYIPAEEA